MTTSAAAPWPWALVPRGLSDDLRPNIERVVAEVIAAVRDEVPEYDRPLEGEFGRLISQGVGVALNQFVDLIGRDLPPAGRDHLRGDGPRGASAGPHARRTAVRLPGRRARVMAQRGDVRGGARIAPDVMYRLAEAIFAYIDRLAAASVAGYAEGQSLREGTLQARRQGLVELLVGPAAPSTETIDQAATGGGLGGADPGRGARRRRRRPCRAGPPDAGGHDRGRPRAARDAGGAGAGAPGQTAAIEVALRGRRAVLGPAVAVEQAGARPIARGRRGRCTSRVPWARRLGAHRGPSPDAAADPGPRAGDGADAPTARGARRAAGRRPRAGCGDAAGLARRSRRRGTSPQPRCTSTHRRCDTGWRGSARSSATSRSMTRRRGWS